MARRDSWPSVLPHPWVASLCAVWRAFPLRNRDGCCLALRPGCPSRPVCSWAACPDVVFELVDQSPELSPRLVLALVWQAWQARRASRWAQVLTWL